MQAEPINQSEVRRVADSHGLDWHYRDTTVSTNADVLQHYDQHRREVVAVSEAQSGGRGRRGRDWHSPYARNLYCTLGLGKAIEANRQGLLSIVTGLALCQALEPLIDTQLSLKWPNDPLHDGRKLGGVLIESRSLADGRFSFAIGFGINVFMQADELRSIAQPATSLNQISSRSLDRSALLATAIDAVSRAIREFDIAAVPGLIQAFSRYDAYHDQPVSLLAGEQRIDGVSRGITDDGRLKLQTGQGIESFAPAEISLRPRD